MTTTPKSHGINMHSLRLGDEVVYNGAVVRVVRLAPDRPNIAPTCDLCVLNTAPATDCCVVRGDQVGFRYMAVVPVDDIPLLVMKGHLA